jgi:hypothetical protein
VRLSVCCQAINDGRKRLQDEMKKNKTDARTAYFNITGRQLPDGCRTVDGIPDETLKSIPGIAKVCLSFPSHCPIGLYQACCYPIYAAAAASITALFDEAVWGDGCSVIIIMLLLKVL